MSNATVRKRVACNLPERAALNRVALRALHAWFLATRAITLGVRAAAYDEAGRVCLVRHRYTPGWYLPGGGVELGEHALAALRRELKEEAALEFSGTPRLHGIFLNAHVSRRDHVLLYVAREIRVLGPRPPDREIAETGFFAVDELPADTTRGTRARLEEIATERTPAPLW
jgi:8-oxo-dGTP pyrophosphatase MutT (NUDIX family)